MKKILGILVVAFIGGAASLTGYKMFLEEPQVIIKEELPALQTVKTNYTTPTLTTSSVPTNFTEAAESTVNAVVHVKNTALRTQQNPWLEHFFGRGSGTRKFEQVGTGSGVIISPDGYIVTNNHVIEGASEIEITLNSRKKLKAELIGTSKDNDIALLKVDIDEDLPYLPFANSDFVKIGEWVLAVGNPYNLTSTVTAGIVSAKGRDLDGNTNTESFIQTDAAVNPGNSGGALVNTRGELIGINTAITSKTGSFIGYSFAVPSNIAKKIIDDLLEFGAVQEAILGIGIDQGDKEIQGVKIGSIDENSEALKAGLKEGDVITKVNNVKISKFSDLKGQLTAKRPGDIIDVTVDRNGDELVKTVKLIKRIVVPTSKVLGTQFKDLTEKEKRKFNIDGGAKITASVNPYFEDYDGLKGYILTKINGENVTSAQHAVELLDSNAKRRYIFEMITPEGKTEMFRY
ncbi:trypsin-like peptidase domain-containing protein [Tenacibaculum sp. MAR_2009_124]|uniref:trypsin-like peptidase domain-containing protein n=1 Tax=Tenacibaculum sp. MAR_2009_124 TaxID=1250059 RepID=UPI000B80FD6A|nr:trypsin-like peptidase domain-containing protein [Tenacibaculum sp. MAR_2009_124]